MQTLRDAQLVLPDYSGNTVANIPSTVGALFGAMSPGLEPLRSELWQPLLAQGDVERVVLIIIDGMGRNIVDAFPNEFTWLEQEATVSGTITSVFPSTTVNALTCLWTGVAPSQHGLVGLELFFPQMGVVGQMLSLTPSFLYAPDALMRAGLDPYTFLPVRGLGDWLGDSDINTLAVKHYSLVNTTLSKMHGRGIAQGYGIVTAADMMWQLTTILKQRQHRVFVSAYWAAVDTLSHRYGYDHEAVAAEVHSFIYLLRQGLMERLTAGERRGTVVLVSADHGQIRTPLEKRIFLQDHPQLQSLLQMRPTGEPHTAYLYAKQGKQRAIIDYVDRRLAHAAVALEADAALDAGMFGPAPYAPSLKDRIGDVILTTRDGYSLVSREGDQYVNEFVGRHGGLSKDEMEVPFYGFRLS